MDGNCYDGRCIYLDPNSSPCNLDFEAMRAFLPDRSYTATNQYHSVIVGPGYDPAITSFGSTGYSCGDGRFDYGLVLHSIGFSGYWTYDLRDTTAGTYTTSVNDDYISAGNGVDRFQNYWADSVYAKFYIPTEWWSEVGRYKHPYFYSTDINFRFLKVANPESYCPPGTIYNPKTGTCDELPDWTWDEELNKYIPFVCLEVHGEDEIKEPGIYKYIIGFDDRWEDDIIKEDTVVSLSYIGGTAKNDVDFFAPIQVTIPMHQKEVEIEIEFKVLDENLNFFITPGSEIYVACEEFEVEIFLDKYFDYSQYDDRRYTTCCRYYSLHFNDWSSCRQIAVPQYPKMTLGDGTIYRTGEF